MKVRRFVNGVEVKAEDLPKYKIHDKQIQNIILQAVVRIKESKKIETTPGI